MSTRLWIPLLSFAFLGACSGSPTAPAPFLSHLRAGAHFPLYTGYAAARERSAFVLDEGYRFRYDADSLGADFITDQAGDIGWAFRVGGRWRYRVGALDRGPVITVSYPDMVQYHLYPAPGLRADMAMVVHSSRAAFWECRLTNESDHPLELGVLAFARAASVFGEVKAGEDPRTLYFTHVEKPDGWVLDHGIPYADSLRDQLILRGGNAPQARSVRLSDDGFQLGEPGDSAAALGFWQQQTLAPGASLRCRLYRMVSPRDEGDPSPVLADSLQRVPLSDYREANEKVVAAYPPPPLKDTPSMALYWSACNMMRQCFYPPEGHLSHNYYVFSREPQWGWGHGGQVFHESITMLAYARLDPAGAMNSQRVFAERQHPNGYINYRTGPYLDEVIRHNGQLTSSAPWYAWLNSEVYDITGDTAFLREMYASSQRFYTFYTSHRDSDQDGLCEWGGEAVLESVRDGLVAVWDQVGYPSSFEALDLNCMLVMEAKSLEKMATVLQLPDDAATWRADYQNRAALINKLCWDTVNHFYYHVDKQTHTFTHRNGDDLKRDEIIGFLPLWAGIADSARAAWLVRHLTDTASFWRRYGVPSLSARDPYYNPRGYWNGPVWIQWNYLIERGLLDYGYHREAAELVRKVKDNMIAVLGQDHELWEFYDPDSTWGGYHRTYIWAGIVNRMMSDLSSSASKKQ